MKTLDQYMPTMREAGGRWFFPRTSIVGTGVAVALLVSAVVFAYRYPTVKADEAAQRLERFNELTAQATAGTQTALSRLAVLVANQPEWVQKVTAEQTANIQGLLGQVQPLTQAQVLQQAEAQQTAWDEAQRLIAASPFKGLKREQIPLSADGKAYLAALEVQRPARFDYQRLADGIELALPALQAAIRLQAEAETLAHRLDVKLNGDKAAPLGSAAAAALGQPAAAPVRQRPQFVSTPAAPAAATAPAIQGATDSLSAAMRQAEREAERQQREAEQEAQRQQQAAEAAERRAEQQAQRKQQEAQRAAERQKREAEAKARAAAAAEERAKREAERQAEQQRIAAQRAAEAKQRECTSSLMARAKCAAEGYNPLTGLKN